MQIRSRTLATLLALIPAPASAQQAISYLSPGGTDGSGCTLAAPCATMAAAVAATTDNGQVVVQGTGRYGMATITRPITIRGEGGPVGVVGGLFISGDATNKVVIEDVNFEGTTPGNNGYAYGVAIYNGAEVVIRNSRFRGYLSAAIRLSPIASTRLTVDNCAVINNPVGIVVMGTGGHLKLFRSLLIGNTDAGLRVSGTGNDALLSGNRMLGSTKALDLIDGGVARSYGDNVITSGDSPTPVTMN